MALLSLCLIAPSVLELLRLELPLYKQQRYENHFQIMKSLNLYFTQKSNLLHQKSCWIHRLSSTHVRRLSALTNWMTPNILDASDWMSGVNTVFRNDLLLMTYSCEAIGAMWAVLIGAWARILDWLRKYLILLQIVRNMKCFSRAHAWII